MTVNNVKITEATIAKTRQHFIDNCKACIADAVEGRTRVNDLARYVESENKRIARFESGEGDHSLTFAQAALWIQTGECVSILA